MQYRFVYIFPVCEALQQPHQDGFGQGGSGDVCPVTALQAGAILQLSSVHGVRQYWKKNLANFISTVPDVDFFKPGLTVCTALSARPLEAG